MCRMRSVAMIFPSCIEGRPNYMIISSLALLSYQNFLFRH
jgi:hypothetical protein